MPTSDLDIENAPFRELRKDINDALQALATQQISSTPPPVTYACQLWADTSVTPPILRIRNTGNTGWLILGRLNQSFLGITPADIGGLAAVNNLGDVANKLTALRNLGITAAAKNAIINGRFDIWQRNVSFSHPAGSANKIQCADRWFATSFPDGGTTAAFTVTRQAHTAGQVEVPYNPTYFSRITNTSIGVSLGANSFHIFNQYIENVYTFSGETVTVSFYGRSSIPGKNLAVELAQFFGSGGTPTPPATGTGDVRVTLTNSWARYTVTVTLPSISGKNFGTIPFSSAIILSFWLQSGTGQASRTGGSAIAWQGTGDTDISDVQVERGSVATPIENRDFAQELLLCRRFYQKSYDYGVYPGAATEIGALHVAYPAGGTGNAGGTVQFVPTMRVAPTVVSYDMAGNANRCYKGVNNVLPTINVVGQNAARIYTTDTTSASLFIANWTADAEY